MGQVLQSYLEIKRKNKTWRLILAFGIRGVFSWYEVAVILYSKTTESLLPSRASRQKETQTPFYFYANTKKSVKVKIIDETMKCWISATYIILTQISQALVVGGFLL